MSEVSSGCERKSVTTRMLWNVCARMISASQASHPGESGLLQQARPQLWMEGTGSVNDPNSCVLACVAGKNDCCNPVNLSKKIKATAPSTTTAPAPMSIMRVRLLCLQASTLSFSRIDSILCFITARAMRMVRVRLPCLAALTQPPFQVCTLKMSSLIRLKGH